MKTLIFLLFPFFLIGQKTSKGVITRVIDGDSFIADVESYKGFEATLRVRLVNVDAPEIEFKPKRKPAQAFGHEAKNYVAKLIEGKEVEITYYGRDYYNRVLAFVRIGGERLDDILLKNGIAWYDNQYHTGKKYKAGAAMEADARAQGLGLWGDPHAIRPSDYRKWDHTK